MLTKKQLYHAASRTLERRREQAQATAQLHLARAIELEPDIAALRDELKQTSAKLARAIFANKGDVSQQIERLQAANLATQQKIKALLCRHQLPEDYLDKKPLCPKCNDYGFVDHKPCRCFLQLLHDLQVEDLQRSTQLQLSSFDSFELSYYPLDSQSGVCPREHMQKVLGFCEKYARSFHSQSGGILMSGKTGLGKTHLSLAIAQAVIDQGHTVVYATASELVRKLSDQFFGKDSDTEDILALLGEVDLLIFDDLGAEFESNFSVSAVYDLLNTRLAAGKPLIVSTNLSPAELQKRYGERIVSRLFSQLVPLNFVGQDVRSILSNQRLGKSLG